jgi:hypothetical protein
MPQPERVEQVAPEQQARLLAPVSHAQAAAVAALELLVEPAVLVAVEQERQLVRVQTEQQTRAVAVAVLVETLLVLAATAAAVLLLSSFAQRN